MIIGTAGHIDHGKSTLVTALTGHAVDRLAEERRRGITIELNFAPLRFDGGPPVGIVDVPGHEDFVRTMVAGATGIDLVLLVVDAVEGIRPQTLEHLAVVEQLRIPRGIPVLTKIDLADPEWVDLVASDLSERLATSPIAFEPAARVSARTGEGIAALRARLHDLAATAPSRPVEAGLRLPIDRVFAVPGVGPVVTGTLWSGAVRVGRQVRVEPGGLLAKVRSVESFGEAVAEALPGNRTAVGLAGVALDAIRRGQVVLDAAEAWPATSVVDASVTLLPDAPRPLAHRIRVRVHHGTAEVLARAYPRASIAPGASGPARLILEAPLVVRGGDRLVLRAYSPVTTIGGGWIADPEPPRRAPWPAALTSESPDARLEALVARRPRGVEQRDMARLLGTSAVLAPPRGIVDVGGRIVLRTTVEEARTRLLRTLEAFHSREPAEQGMSLETLRAALDGATWLADSLLADLGSGGTIVSTGGVARLASHRPMSQGGEEEVDRVVAALRTRGLESASAADLGPLPGLRDPAGALRIAAARGLIESVEPNRYLSADALQRFTEVVRQVGQGNVEISPAAIREQLGLSRKHLIPLLEWADRKGITWRDREGVRRLQK